MGTDILDREFARRCEEGSDISAHLPLLSELAKTCAHVTEFGVRRGNSTVALLHGLCRRGSGTLKSYDIDPHCVEGLPALPPGVGWQFELADTAKLCDIETTDMLFVDTWHTAEHVRAELTQAKNVNWYIALHDTTTFAGPRQGDGGGDGICVAIFDFLASKEGRNWTVHHHNAANNGMLVLRRFAR